MNDKIGLKGEYIIEKVNKDGSREEIFRKENHLTEFVKWYMLSQFSAIFNSPLYNKGATNGNLMGVSGISYRNNNNQSYFYIPGSLCLYALNEEYEDVTQYNTYPFISGLREVDMSKITFIGSDTTTGDIYGTPCPTDCLNFSVPKLISRSWKISGPNGLGVIKSLCIGRDVHTDFVNDAYINVMMQQNAPTISKRICQTYTDDLGNEYDITGYLPPIEGFSDNTFYFGVAGTSNTVFKSYNIEEDEYKNILSTDSVRNIPTCGIGYNAFKYGDGYICTINSNNSPIYYNVTTNEKKSILSYTYNHCYKKGTKIIGNSSSNVSVWDMETMRADTTLFGSSTVSISSICNNLPTWFKPSELGTRNDNENWLILDSTYHICIECTDLTDCLGTMVNWYYHNGSSLANVTINNKLHFILGSEYEDIGSYTHGTITGNVSSSSTSVAFTVSYPEVATDMYSIVSGIKDKDGNDIVQTEDSEYIFTYNLRFL